MNIKKNIIPIVAIVIPILMIFLIAGSIYLPGFFAQPQYNFLYANGDDYYSYSQYHYTVQAEKLVKNEITRSDHYPYPRGDTKLYIHDVMKNKSTEISFAEGQKLNLDASMQSPDGFEVVYGNRGDGLFPFFFVSERCNNTQYIKGHGANKKLNLQSNSSCYNNFHFIGWIK